MLLNLLKTIKRFVLKDWIEVLESKQVKVF